VGNRTAYTLTTPLDGTRVTTYTYDAANRLTKVGGVVYTWDARGNLTGDGAFTYTYSAAGRMVRAESLTTTLVYTYNADGLRVAQSVDSAATAFVWDWAAGVPEMLDDGRYTYLIGHDTLGWQTGSDWRFVLPDALGSVRQETDATGAVTAVREWSPYGEEVGGAQAGLGFTGEWFDANVGLTYLRARWYDGTIGRFTQVDPWEGDPWRPLSLQPYQYASVNPVNRIDPSGLYDEIEIHYNLTLKLAMEVGFSNEWGIKIARQIAAGDQQVDKSKNLDSSPFGCNYCHFTPLGEAIRRTNIALESLNPYLFGATLHPLQDWFSHGYEGYTQSHIDTVRSGKYYPTPGRPFKLIEEFYNGTRGGYLGLPGYPAHPKPQVESQLRARYPNVDFSSFTDDDWIDLYLREFTVPRAPERGYFGYNTDAYYEGTRRDSTMKEITKSFLRLFYQHVIMRPCEIYNLVDEDVSDKEIEAFLRQ